MILQFLQAAVLRQEFREMLRAGESLQINEDRVALHFAGIADPQMIGICEHGHNLGADLFRFLGEIDAVPQGFAHFGLAVDAGQPQAGGIFRQHDLGIREGFPVDAVEFMDDFFALLQHGQLILPYRHSRCPKSGDVRRLADGIAEEAYRNAGLKIPHLDLSLYSGISLYPGDGHQVHIIKGKFRQLRHRGLDKQGGFLRIQAAGQIVQGYLHDILTDLLRVFRVISEGLGVGDHNINFVVAAGILKFYPLFQGSHIMSHMKAACGPVAGEDDLFHMLCSFKNQNGIRIPLAPAMSLLIIVLKFISVNRKRRVSRRGIERGGSPAGGDPPKPRKPFSPRRGRGR